MKQDYLDLIQIALWGGREPAWPVNETDKLMAFYVRQGLGPLVFPCVLAQPDIPSSAKQQMKAVCMQNMTQQVKLQHTLELAWNALEQAGIHAVLMKGAGLAAFYPSPEQRTWGDIDLFVGKDQYHPACAVMRDTFPEALKFDEELDHYKHYNLIADGISIEIHRVSVGLQHPIDAHRYARIEKEGMANSQQLIVNGFTVRIPDPTFNALFVCMHSWEHMLTQGANLRQLCDLALLLHHYRGQIDIPRLKRYLKALHMMDVWQVFMCILADALLLPFEETVLFERKREVTLRALRLYGDLINGRMVAPQPTEEAPRNRLLRKTHTMHERLRNALRIKQYSPEYARHMLWETFLHGGLRLFAKDRHWE